MSVFEIVMLVCFGAAWPVSIYKSLKTRQVAGKSLPFLVIIVVGYIAGILHKLLFHFDLVIYLYILNALMVGADIALYLRNRAVSHPPEPRRRRRGTIEGGGLIGECPDRLPAQIRLHRRVPPGARAADRRRAGDRGPGVAAHPRYRSISMRC